MATRTLRELTRYALVGVISNGVLYAVYLILTTSGASPKVALTLVYCAGVLGTFLFNRGWTFGHGGRASHSLARYLASYAFVYMLNMAALHVLTNQLALPHEWSVLVLIVASAAALFVLQKYWVFARSLSTPFPTGR